MSQNFQPIQIIRNISDTSKTGHLEITANSVTWKLYLIKGKLQYAYHSLQSLDTLKYYLSRLNHGMVAKMTVMLNQKTIDNQEFSPSFITQLVAQNNLTSSEKTILIKALTQDAFESFLWLTDAEYHWKSTDSFQFFNGLTTIEDNLLEISPLLKSLQIRLEAWQTLSPIITSPYQRIVCVNPSLLRQPVPSGKLSPAILEKMIKLMQGATIRQMGLFLKQEDLKVAQLLFPYVKHKILRLHLPKSPLDTLPKIPQLPLNFEQSSAKVNLPTQTQSLKTIESQKTKVRSLADDVYLTTEIKPIVQLQSKPKIDKRKIYKIVCIDDSAAMLDMIKSYLGSEKYQVFMVENPMSSLTHLFQIKPDLILMDFSMPGINGNRLSQILKRSPAFKNTPIIMISGNSNMFNQENIQDFGVIDYLPKPFTQKTLLAMVEKHLV